jgi:hypothetical protein
MISTQNVTMLEWACDDLVVALGDLRAQRGTVSDVMACLQRVADLKERVENEARD